MAEVFLGVKPARKAPRLYGMAPFPPQKAEQDLLSRDIIQEHRVSLIENTKSQVY